MSDLDRWKDKVELSLDGRQIFFLFFGAAVLACLVFVLGVLVGRRLEARALALAPPPIDDPLVALDQVGDRDEADEGLTFHRTLAEAEPAAKPSPPPVVASVPPPVVVASVKKVETPAVVALAPPPRAPIAPRAAPLPKRPTEEPPGKRSAAGERTGEHPAPSAATAAAPTPTPAPEAEPPSHFTLQLSAFPEREDAEQFRRKMKAAGYDAFIVTSDIPGKGVFYRVRVGDFPSRQAALDAKAAFEQRQHVVAYVAKM